MAQLPVHDPANGELINHVELATTADCLTAVDTAAEALDGWKRQAPRDRAEVLRRAFELMTAERESLARLITRENGKVLSEARAEVGYAAEFFRWFAEEAVRVGGELRTAPGGDKRIVVLPHPVGVALLITPWNFPAAMATRKIAPALAAGCTLVLKPAPETPLTAFAVAELLQRAGVPPGVVQVVLPEPPTEAVPTMLAHPAVRKLSFTGSTEVGALLLREAAPHIISCSMELGGNAPFLVFDDADLDLAVESAVVAKLRNTGASCIAANRFYVHDAVTEEFTRRLAAAMAARRVDVGTAPGAEVGALVNESERDKVAALVTGALDAGGRVRAGGHAPERPGAFYLPTVIDQVSPDADILRHEIFGPVAPVTTFQYDDEAVRLANDSPVGLMSYVMTSDLQRGFRVAESIETGMVSLNRGLISDPAAPFGGMKGSGLGREGGFEGIEEYLELQYVGVSW
jgi:succinate-semialdehyde dehydrogenase/glutarate-semialdehyde dehydrogenase